MELPDIEPCPRCGSEAYHYQYGGKPVSLIGVICDNKECDIEGKKFPIDSPDAARLSIEHWNNQQQIATLRADLERARWVSVEEELPKPGDTVIAYCLDFPNCPVGPAQMHRGKWFDLEVVDRDGGWEELFNVTHWMPLPPPPQEGL